MFNLTYITYQVFPNEKANTIQTIRMLESLCSIGINTQLIFPDRGNIDNNNEEIIKFSYNFITNYNKNVVDITDCFLNIKETLYIDNTHYNDKGNEILAYKIADILLQDQ